MWNFSKIAGKPAIIGHRGARSIAPENTEIGIVSAISLGLPAVEFDVDLTKDGIPVVIHQETLEPNWPARTIQLATRSPERAWIQQHTLAEIKTLDAGGWFSPNFAGVAIPTLDEILSLQWGTTTALMELKDPFFWSPAHTRESALHRKLITEATIYAVERFISRGGSIAVLSFDWELLSLWKDLQPKTPRILAVWTDRSGKAKEVFAEASPAEIAALTIAEPMAIHEPEWAAGATKAGIPLLAYEVTPALNEAESGATVQSRWSALERAGVVGIATDFPNRVFG